MTASRERIRAHGATVAMNRVLAAIERYGNLLTHEEHVAAVTLAAGLDAVAAGRRARAADGTLLVEARP